jgi:sialidase-1
MHMLQIVTVAKSTKEFTRKSEGDVIELRDGRLLIVYMEFTGDGSDYAKTLIVSRISDDGGLTWKNRKVIAETVPGDINVYSPNLIRALDGSILLIFMRQHSSNPRTTTMIAYKSFDEGETFQPYSEFAKKMEYSLCNAVLKRLDSGRLLLPVSPSFKASVLYSDDDGLTWQESKNRVFLPMRGAMEPHAEQTRDGRVLMVIRNQLGSLFIAESKDQGETWEKPQTSGLRTPESCPELTRIPGTNDLLMIWNNSPYDPDFRSHYGKRSPLSCAVSKDNGRTWENIKDIETDSTRAFSNPGCRFLSDGKAVINYWTCEYLPDWRMQDVIDLRVAIIHKQWFYT